MNIEQHRAQVAPSETMMVVRTEKPPDAKLRRETQRGGGVKGKRFYFGKKEKKKKNVQWELGWRGRERENTKTDTQVLTLFFLFCLFNLVNGCLCTSNVGWDINKKHRV